MSVSKLQYPKPWRWYNSERRESRGVVEDTIESDYIFYDTQHFIVDLSIATEEDPYRLVLFTFSNGVKLVWDMYKSSESSKYYTIRVKKHLFDKNDIEIDRLPWQQTYLTIYKQQYSDLTHVDLFYSTSLAYYYSSNYLQPFGIVSTYNATASPYDAPNITNNTVGRSRYANYYLRNYAYDINIDTDAKLNDLLDKLENGGDGTIITPISPSEDTSGVGGGDSANPDYNPFSDPINFPDLPTGGSALASGFIKLYRPTSGELNQLAAKLWSDSFIEEIKKIQNDPLEAIISLHSVPFGIVGASRQTCRIGNYDSEIVMDTIGAQFYTVDCGNISIPEHWASALDYAPYTDIEIYLPFCGVKPLQIDDVMNRVLNVKYNIDILTGAAICMVKCGDSVLYTYNTEIAQNIPLSASNHAQLYQSIISAASAVVGVASGGAGAVVGAVQSAATVASSKHSQVSRGGSLGGSVGVLGDFVPYLIIHRPIQSLAADFAHKKGYPSNITATLSSVSGYTEVDSIHLEKIPCTDMEREELLRILQEGVIL